MKGWRGRFDFSSLALAGQRRLFQLLDEVTVRWPDLAGVHKDRRTLAIGVSALLLVGAGGGTTAVMLGLGRATAAATTSKHPPHPELDVAKPAVPQQLVIRYRKDITDAQIQAVHDQLHLTRRQYVAKLHIESVQVPGGMDLRALRQQLVKLKVVAGAEPNYILRTRDYTPNDPYFASPFATSHDGGVAEWGLTQVKGPAAWSTFRGPGSTLIAVVDTGVDSTHPDLAGRVLPGFNFVDNDTDTQDDHGHGTMVAGVAAAVTDNGSGIASMSFNSAQILPVKVLDRLGNGSEVAVADGITYATDQGARVINLSLGGSNYTQVIQDAVDYAWSKGAVVVAAAGNNGNNTPEYPAAESHVVGVTASDSQDHLPGFDSYGNEVTLTAPGVAILGTMPTYPVHMTSDLGYFQNYDAFDGTSAAAPFVSGLAALLISQAQGNITNAAVVQALERSADTLGGNAGWNQNAGWGRIDAANAVAGNFRSDSAGGIHGQVVDGSGNPVGGAVVSVGGTSMTTGSDGMYRLKGLAANGSPYTLGVTANGVSYQSNPVTVTGGADAFADVSIGAGSVASNQVQNGGFETGSFGPWTPGGGNPQPTISTAQVHSGSYSALLGTSGGKEASGDSWVKQSVAVQIPSGSSKATLSFWYWAGSTDIQPFDWQEAQVQDQSGNQLASIFKQASDAMAWQQVTFDLTPYAGKTVQLYFNVHQDGAGDLTWMYLDDVAVSYS